MAGAGIEFISVDGAPERKAAEALITEYLHVIARTAASSLGLSFDVAAMVRSDIGDETKFHPPNGRFYLVRQDGGYIGVGCLRRLSGEVAEIQRMYVQPQKRGIGAGRRLLERLLSDARAMGFRAVRLESLGFLSAAHALYRSAGFAQIAPYADNSMRDYQPAETLDAYRASAVFMELKL